MSKLSDVLGYDFTLPPVETVQPKEIQLGYAMSNAGIRIPDEIIFDGDIHRFGKDKACWYVAYDGQIPAGSFGDWSNGSTITWRANIGRQLSFVEDLAYKKSMAEAKEKRDREFAIKRENASDTAKQILATAAHADDSHPYLLKKGIKANGAMVAGDGRLVIPVCADGANDVRSVQYIGADSAKYFLTGGQTGGCWYEIGNTHNASIVYVAEGFATAATIHEETGKPCVVAFNAENLISIAQKLRDKFGIACSIVFCADLDNSGVGVRCSNKAAAIIGGKVVISPSSTDFNDARQAGVDILSILAPQKQQDWLIHADELVASQMFVKWLVKGWIPRESLIMLHGPSGSGKSLVVLDMVARIASDIDDWEGHKVRHGQVIYLAGEGYIGMNARLRAWREANIATEMDMWISRTGCGLNSPQGYQLARDAILAVGGKPAIVVVDTLHRFMIGDENSAQDAGDMIKACNWLQDEFKCSVLLVHHTGVAEGSQSRARGSSAWKGAMESEISIKPQEQDQPLEVINIKSKDSALAETKFMRIHGHVFDKWTDEDGEKISGAVVKSAEKPTAEKPNKKVFELQKTLEQALKKYNQPMDDGSAFISANDLSDFFVDENGEKTGTMRQRLARFKKECISNCVTEQIGNGYKALLPVNLI